MFKPDAAYSTAVHWLTPASGYGGVVIEINRAHIYFKHFANLYSKRIGDSDSIPNPLPPITADTEWFVVPLLRRLARVHFLGSPLFPSLQCNES